MPDKELADGGLILVGGALLLTPGFLSDVLGFLCVLPVTRPAMRRLVSWFFDRRVKKMAAASPYRAPLPDARAAGPSTDTSPGEATGAVPVWCTAK